MKAKYKIVPDKLEFSGRDIYQIHQKKWWGWKKFDWWFDYDRAVLCVKHLSRGAKYFDENGEEIK